MRAGEDKKESMRQRYSVRSKSFLRKSEHKGLERLRVQEEHRSVCTESTWETPREGEEPGNERVST